MLLRRLGSLLRCGPRSAVAVHVLLLVVMAAGWAVAGGSAAGAARAGAGTTGTTGTSAPVATPPMGWASWNSFAARIDFNVIKAQVDAMVSSGLKDAGYEYVNIDEGWWQGTRDAAGNITVDTAEWPGGMKAIADYIHGKGLKAGIYTDAGRDGCGYYYPTGRPAAPGSGSEGHYDQDFLQFSQWGFDFVKVDWCGGQAEGLDPRTTYQAISDAIGRATARTGRPMVLSICNWGVRNPWEWAPAMSTMWRTSGDIIYWGQSPSMNNVLANFDSAQHPSAQSPGHYNDPDMLIAGMPGFAAAQNRTHLGLWAISGAPLLTGNKLTEMSAETRAILTNREVLAIDQDPLGRQGVKVAEDQTGRQVYSRVLSGTDRRAVLLLNRTTSPASITARWSNLGLSGAATVRNLWTGSDAGTFDGSYTTTVPAREAVLLTVTAAGSTPGPTPTPGLGDCAAAYRTVSGWQGGFQAEVTVRNSGTAAISGWTVPMTLAAGQNISNLWNGVNTGASGSISVRNASHNGALAPGASTTFGFVATGDGAAAPTGLGCSRT